MKLNILETTSNLLNHANMQHPGYIESLQNKPEQLKKAAGKERENFFNKTFSQEKLEDLLVELIAVEDLPFKFVESDTLWELLSICNPKVKKFKADKLKQLMNQRFIKEERLIMEEIKAIKSKISFAHDAWTASNDLPFLGVSAHFIDDNFKLQNALLDFVPLPGSHTGKRLNEAFSNVNFENYKIAKKQVGLVTLDNASNNDTFVEEFCLATGISTDVHNRCYDHVQDLAVKDFVKVVENQTEKLKNGVSAIKASPK